MLSWVVTLRSTLRRTRKSHAIRLFRAPSFTSSVSSYPPVSRLPSSVPSSKFRILQVLCLRFLRKHRGCGGILPTLERHEPCCLRELPTLLKFFLFMSLRTLLRFFASAKRSTLLFSSNSELFGKNTQGGVSESPFLGRLDVGTFRCAFWIPNGVTGRSPIRPIAAKRLWCHNPQRYEISSRS